MGHSYHPGGSLVVVTVSPGFDVELRPLPFRRRPPTSQLTQTRNGPIFGKNRSRNVRLASENSETELERKRFSREATSALVELTANLMRITRGAGNPSRLLAQTLSFLEPAAAYYRDHPDAALDFELTKALRSVFEEGAPPSQSEEAALRKDAENLMLLGALQIIASRLLGQKAQERAGETQMSQGYRELRELRDEMRRRARAQLTAHGRGQAAAAAAKSRSKRGKT